MCGQWWMTEISLLSSAAQPQAAQLTMAAAVSRSENAGRGSVGESGAFGQAIQDAREPALVQTPAHFGELQCQVMLVMKRRHAPGVSAGGCASSAREEPGRHMPKALLSADSKRPSASTG